MKKIIYLTVLIFWGVLYTNALPQIQIDTLLKKTVGPGVEYYHMNAPSVPWDIYMLKVDLKNPYISLETCLANEKRLSSKEKTSSMSTRRNAAGHWTVGGVNSDFFNPDGSPCNMQVEQGEIVQKQNGYPAIAFTKQDKMYMGTLSFAGKALLGNSSVNITSVNTPRTAAADVIMYNRFNGASTGTDTSGKELLLRPLKPWMANDTIPCTIDSIETNRGNMKITSGYAVLSLGSSAMSSFSSLRKGDTLRLSLSAFQGLKQVFELVGGNPIVVKNGAMAPLDSGSFNITRHPRTAIGVNADTSVVYLIEIDGRQSSSLGIDLFDLARLMLRWGIYQGMNFDGGGSSTLVVRNLVQNSPSDVGGERSVANSLLIISSAPAGALRYLELFPKTTKVFAGNQQQYTLNALDEYYNPLSPPSSTIQYSLSKPSLGTINSTGLFTAGNAVDTGYVIVTAGSIKDSAKVIVKTLGRVNLQPKRVATDNQLLVAFTLKGYDTDGIEVAVQTAAIQWKCSDTTVGVIDAMGQFQGKKPGIAKIIALYGGKSDTAEARVEIGYGKRIVDSLESLNSWSIGGLNIDSVNTTAAISNQYTTLGIASIKTDYQFLYTSGQYNWLYLKTDNLIYGVPDSIMVDVRSNGQSHRIFFDFTDALNQNIRVMGHKIASRANAYETIRGFFPKTGTIVYPLVLKSITVALGSEQVSGQIYQGTLYFDNLQTKYVLNAPTGMESGMGINPKEFYLYPNFPNPCNPSTKISFSVPEPAQVKLTLFSVLGKQVLNKNFSVSQPGLHSCEITTADLPSGAYFFRVSAFGEKSDYHATRKMLVLK